jgi:hypothetical protein
MEEFRGQALLPDLQHSVQQDLPGVELLAVLHYREPRVSVHLQSTGAILEGNHPGEIFIIQNVRFRANIWVKLSDFHN